MAMTNSSISVLQVMWPKVMTLAKTLWSPTCQSVSLFTIQLLIGSLIVYRCDWSSEPPEEKKKKV